MTLNLFSGKCRAFATVVYLIVSLSVPLLLVSLSSCSDDPVEQTPPPPEPPADPYLYFKVNESSYQRWLIVTNGDGEIVGYKKIDAAGAEGELTERLAEITHDYINLHLVTVIVDAPSNYKSLSHDVLGLGLPIGYEWYDQFEPAAELPAENHTSITVYNRPRPSQMFTNSTSTELSDPESLYHDESDDIYYESTWSDIAYPVTNPASLLTIYTGAQAKYTEVENTDGITQTFTYPDDFADFPIEVTASLESEGKPVFFTTGLNDSDEATLFLLSFSHEEVPASRVHFAILARIRPVFNLFKQW